MDTHELWYGCIKQKYTDGVKLCYIYTDNFIIPIKTDEFWKDIKDDVEKKVWYAYNAVHNI